MTDFSAPWRSPGGAENALALRTRFAKGFEAIAEFDRIGHLLLYRASSFAPISGLEAVVGIALLRRAVSLFTGLRTLFESSAIDPAKALVRAHFELWLHYRCLAYGKLEHLFLQSETNPKDREPRARRYFVAAERRGLRARALILKDASPFPPSSDEARSALQDELEREGARFRSEYADEWGYFGDVTPETIVRHVGGRDEPPWFAKEFEPAKVRSIAALAAAFQYGWEYEFLYDAWSALVHARGIRQDVTISATQLEVHHPHDPEWFQALAFWGLSWHGMLLMTAAKWHAPEMIEQLQALHTRYRTHIDQLRPESIPSLLS